jgi:hypothetical protein
MDAAGIGSSFKGKPTTMDHFILLEAVNLYAAAFDTDQLSVIRGSSFILKEAIGHIEHQFKDRIVSLTTGASSGLFLVAGAEDAVGLCDDIVDTLNRRPYHHFTFLVEHCAAADPLQAKEQLRAQIRFRQMASLTLALDRFDATHTRRNQPCELEGRRIAARETNRKVQIRGENKDRRLSLSIHDRLLHGRGKRQDHYFHESLPEATEKLKNYTFTDDLESLSDNPDYPLLNRKIAVVYIDGNRFGAIQREMLEQARQAGRDLVESQRSFDQTLRELRLEFLHDLLLGMISGQGTRFPDATTVTLEGKKAIRFETLLWGGDEMLFVMPAWIGFEFIQYFFEKTAHWETPEGRQLTHAAGIVFCHAKSPIRIIRRIAQSIADTMKESLGDEREKNFWDYMVLESIDYPTTDDIGHFNRLRYEKWATNRKSYLTPLSDWPQSKDQFTQQIAKESISRRQFYRILNATETDPQESSVTWQELTDMEHSLTEKAGAQTTAERRMLQLIEADDRLVVADLLARLGRECFKLDMDTDNERIWLWLHLVELWDYLVPQKREVGA